MEYMDPFLMEELVAATAGMMSSLVPSSLLSIATYILTSFGLYTLATRRGIDHAWLSWVPVLNVWIIGSLSDQYRYVVKGQVKSKRKSLLVLNLLSLLISIIMISVCVFMLVNLVTDAIYGAAEEEILTTAMGSLLGILALLLPMAGIAIAAAVVRYMALYDIYTSMDPDNNVLFTVLSILFSVTEPFFLFFNRNKDGGMPPRKPEPQWIPPAQEYDARQENKDFL